ncbi:sigma-70 family RNA polymerase sigma factor [Actinacidiphila rubida]|uniref:RNA polymerase sigma-70 factor, ECF subfamily n=1 Tax=Actinacidiphila rubida TaxID=310780 RepID=A0A1H8LVX8_9ACTN|nr:sigma-70 family RNA polymerase sigma factor [Actinacidiphila rubida]SEO09038.1 RNA polymerase sigma-70 factor, ECF subfamily [Actinacidiphila rubida]
MGECDGVDDHGWLTDRFAENQRQLHAVAYRMLGSASEADDALQDAWLRAARADPSGIGNPAAWLTTIVSRVCLNMLRSRERRREDPLDAAAGGRTAPAEDGGDPEREAVLADSVGLALLVVLDTLAPAERVAFVLHDMFAVPFDEVGPLLERSPAAARQLASRARRRVEGVPAVPGEDLARQRRVVEAYLAAAREGDFDALLSLLDPDVVLRADAAVGPTPSPAVLHGARAVSRGAFASAVRARFTAAALVDGTAGLVMARGGRAAVVLAFTVDAGGMITAIDVIAEPARLRALDLAVLDG